MNNPFIRLSAALILGASWVIAWHQLLYAAHLPGDSFTAAVFLLIALLLQFVVLGRERASSKMPIPIFFSGVVLGLGILAALVLIPVGAGTRMLASHKFSIAGTELSSTFFFELAVFLIIVGVVTTALVTFKEPD